MPLSELLNTDEDTIAEFLTTHRHYLQHEQIHVQNPTEPDSTREYEIIGVGEEVVMYIETSESPHEQWNEDQFVRIDDMAEVDSDANDRSLPQEFLRGIKQHFETEEKLLTGTEVQLVDVHHNHSDRIKEMIGETGLVVHPGGYGWPDGKVKVAFNADTFEQARQATTSSWISYQWLEVQSELAAKYPW